ncbi:hypothetical protein CLOM_g7555, partial [Closterium sp. NIES-68]
LNGRQGDGQEERLVVTLDGQTDGQIDGRQEIRQSNRRDEIHGSGRYNGVAELSGDAASGRVGGINGNSDDGSSSAGVKGENVTLPHRYSLLDTSLSGTSTMTTSTVSFVQQHDSVLDEHCARHRVARSPLLTAVKISVSSEEDFAQRLQYSPRSTVILELQADIALTRGLLFNASFACTILAPAPPRPTARRSRSPAPTSRSPNLEHEQRARARGEFPAAVHRRVWRVREHP